MITFACVCVGKKYGPIYVQRLYNMVLANTKIPFRFVCFSDSYGFGKNIHVIRVDSKKYHGWWAKMCLFDPALRGNGQCVYMDLDMVIVGNIDPLLTWKGDFAICENFTKLAGNKTWPCDYGSCVMSFGDRWGKEVWDEFSANFKRIITENPKGDQQAIEKMVPSAVYLQDVLPEGFFLGYRNLSEHHSAKPENCSVVVFAGSKKPHNCSVPWVTQAWEVERI